MNQSITNPSARQRGVASLGIVALLFMIVFISLLRNQELTGSVVRDALSSDQRVQSLYLAESGLERAAQRYAAGAACTSTSNETLTMPGVGSFGLNYLGASDFDGTACPAATCGNTYCRVQSTGKSFAADGQTTVDARTLEVLLVQKALNASGTKALTAVTVNGNPHYTITNTVSASEKPLYVLTVFWTIAANRPAKILNVKYGSSLMSTPFTTAPSTAPAAPAINTNDAYAVQIYYLVNPPVGTSTVDITFDASPAGIAVGNVNLNGVDQSNPIASFDSIASATAVSAISHNVTLPSNGVVIDALSRNNGGAATGPSCSTLSTTNLYSSNANNVAGESWFCGPAGASGASFNMGYTFTQKAAAYALITVRPDSTSGGGSRVRFPGAGVVKWHEVATGPQ
ncbi:hypothetical protein KTQ42_02340|uniref:hypothetical protein n=1 Tax=Noviherbaspirillum sp. L7-7A TaxID=2850560 RepID=UPI001C2C7C8D|nr:hypothetical protein [Noviherbaspirillum sp. L7-7A]MBV0878143.1 hypothetical protein [Noviherbaspirillum sp. L7-7A]